MILVDVVVVVVVRLRQKFQIRVNKRQIIKPEIYQQDAFISPCIFKPFATCHVLISLI